MIALESAFAEVVRLSWHGSLLVALYGMVRFVLPRQLSSRLLFAGWLVVVAGLLLPWRVPVSWHPLAMTDSPATAVAEPAEQAELFELKQFQPGAAVKMEAAEKPEVASRAEVTFMISGRKVMIARDWLRALAGLWLAVAAGLVLVRWVALARLHRDLNRTQQRVDDRLAAAVEAEAAALGLRQAPQIVVTPLVETPALCGIFRPRLLFPVRFENGVSPEELRWVVRHELGHLLRRDTWAQAWMQAVCAVHWFNPLVWAAARLARQDCELACDESVLRRHAGGAGDRLAYGQTLLKVLGGARDGRRLPAAVGIVENRRQLMKRIALIADHRPRSLARALTGVALLAGAVYLGATEAAPPAAVAPPPKAPAAAQAIPFGAPPKLSAEQQAARAAYEEKRKKWEEEVTLELVGIGRPAGVPVALVAVGGNLCTAMVHFDLAGHRVVAIDPEGGRVTLRRRDGPERVLELSANPIKLPELNERQVEFMLSKESIKRLHSFRGMPPELVMIWDKVSREGQTQVLMGYLQRGMVVAMVISPSGAGGSSGRLLGEKINQRLSEQRKLFAASLTPEQREIYDFRQTAIRFTDPPAEREKQMAAARELQARQDAMLASLTSEQRALYDEYQSWLKP